MKQVPRAQESCRARPASRTGKGPVSEIVIGARPN